MFERLFSEDFSIDLLRSWQKVGKVKDGAYFSLLHIRSAYLEILRFPMGGAY